MDPLAQLKDIHLPEQINNYPIAPGWWLVLIFTITLLVLAFHWFRNFRKARIVKKQILAKLNDSNSIEQSNELLKLALLSYFPRYQTANLYGDKLTTFLTAQLPEKKQATFKKLNPFSFETMYQENCDIDVQAFNQSVIYWLTNALPPKKGGRND
ncbi:DUF4381 domain-containing protein [Thalassotalea sp. M1531]|uniref:DUF4381 domain-containing protein n=1 Tax=Thalassotalea algicola TaxID=2716224 RepID=A0A7Y0Q7E9_9GAMM|nr:DUF4381 domain-containing protein [Thalassotalea algicola]NMP32989.1 DUF4381 domain-containing protein [Thalassotalea algicola]